MHTVSVCVTCVRAYVCECGCFSHAGLEDLLFGLGDREGGLYSRFHKQNKLNEVPELIEIITFFLVRLGCSVMSSIVY